MLLMGSSADWTWLRRESELEDRSNTISLTEKQREKQQQQKSWNRTLKTLVQLQRCDVYVSQYHKNKKKRNRKKYFE